jgi:hypothetical protein
MMNLLVNNVSRALRAGNTPQGGYVKEPTVQHVAAVLNRTQRAAGAGGLQSSSRCFEHKKRGARKAPLLIDSSPQG